MINDLIWITGPKASIVRKKSSNFWVFQPKQDSPHQKNDGRKSQRQLNIGLLAQLNQPEDALLASPGILRGSIIQLNPNSRSSVVIALLLFLILSLFAYISWQQNIIVQSSPMPLQSPIHCLIIFLGVLLLTISFMNFIESRLLYPSLSHKAATLSFGYLGLFANPLVWKLGAFVREALLLFILSFALMGLGFVTLQIYPLMGIGLFTGAWLYVMVSAFPLQSGPGTAIYEKLMKEEDLPSALTWAIKGAYLPAGQAIQSEGKFLFRLGALLLISWILIGSTSFLILSNYIETFKGIDPLVVKLVLNLTGILFIIWTLKQMVTFYWQALKLRNKSKIRDYIPTDAERSQWETHNSLLKHIPELAKLHWNWKFIPAGTFIIRKSDIDRQFFWLLSGEAKVLGRSPGGHIKHLATLHSGTGFGELGLIAQQPRIADVLITMNSTVATLDYNEFKKLEATKIENEFNDIVQASQEFDKSEMFSTIPSYIKEKWLSEGLIQKFETNDLIIENGSMDQWMGMVVRGNVDVKRNGQSVAVMGPSQIFGEMAFLTHSPRQADIIAKEPVTLIRWEAEWWSQKIKESGLEVYVNQLISLRNNEQAKSSTKGDAE
jgi:CRP-like cAMP-binding protein